MSRVHSRGGRPHKQPSCEALGWGLGGVTRRRVCHVLSGMMGHWREEQTYLVRNGQARGFSQELRGGDPRYHLASTSVYPGSVCVCVCRVRAGSSDGHAQAAWLNPHRAGDKQHHLLIKTPIWALSTRRDRPEPQHQPANSSHREYLPAWTRNASLIIPLLGNDFFLCGPQQSLALNVTAYFIAMKTSLHSPAVLRVSGQSLGEGLLFVHRSVPHTCPHLHVPLRPRGSQCH